MLADDEFERVEALVGVAAYREVIAGALAQLTADQRQAVQLRVIEELSYGSVAERLGVSEQSARLVSRVRYVPFTTIEANPSLQEMS